MMNDSEMNSFPSKLSDIQPFSNWDAQGILTIKPIYSYIQKFAVYTAICMCIL